MRLTIKFSILNLVSNQFMSFKIDSLGNHTEIGLEVYNWHCLQLAYHNLLYVLNSYQMAATVFIFGNRNQPQELKSGKWSGHNTTRIFFCIQKSSTKSLSRKLWDWFFLSQILWDWFTTKRTWWKWLFTKSRSILCGLIDYFFYIDQISVFNLM